MIGLKKERLNLNLILGLKTISHNSHMQKTELSQKRWNTLQLERIVLIQIKKH